MQILELPGLAPHRRAEDVPLNTPSRSRIAESAQNGCFAQALLQRSHAFLKSQRPADALHDAQARIRAVLRDLDVAPVTGRNGTG